MTDDQLAAYLGLTTAQAGMVKDANPERWERYRRVAATFQLVELWDHGIGPLPPGVMIDTPRTIRRAGQ